MRRKYEYKYLTEDDKKIIDKEIKKIGKNELYNKVEHNIIVDWIAELQNQPDAFKEINKGPWTTVKWKYDYFNKPVIIDLNSIEQEMLYYIDKKRFMNCGYVTEEVQPRKKK